MAFSVEEIKGSIKSAGMMHASHYELQVTPKGGGDGSLLKIRADSVSLPGVSFASVDQYKPYGTARTYQIAHTFTPQEIAVSHLIDQKADVLKALMDWANVVVDFQGKTGSPFTAGYFDDYKSDGIIFLYGNDGVLAKQLTLIDMYPASIDQVQMAWASSDEIARVNVSYKFVDFVIS